MVGLDADAAYRELAAAVLGYFRARGALDPEDLVGEVFLQVARDGGRFRDADDPRAVRRWVFTIARNRLIDEARRRRRRPPMSEHAVPDRPGPDEFEAIDPALVAALGALTEDQREVVALRFVAGLPLEDVARVTRRRVGAVKALQHRAMENLRAAVSPPDPEAL